MLLSSECSVISSLFYSGQPSDWLKCPYQGSVLYVAGTVGTDLIREVSLFQREFCTHLYVAGTVGTDLIREVASMKPTSQQLHLC